MLTVVAQAQPPKVYTDPAEIQKLAPEVEGLPVGVVVHARNGRVLELTETAFLGNPPVLCWYAPALDVVAACEDGKGTALTILVNLNTGRRVSAPGLAGLTPEPGLIAIGPSGPGGPDTDSITLVKATPNDLDDQGGAQFDETHLPGGWIDAQCYRLAGKDRRGGGWLEKTAKGWVQVSSRKSAVCRKRHGG